MGNIIFNINDKVRLKKHPNVTGLVKSLFKDFNAHQTQGEVIGVAFSFSRPTDFNAVLVNAIELISND